MLSITTDYVKDTGNPAPYLRRIAAAGFSHVHWCHHWNSDFTYSTPEIDQIARWLQAYGLQLLDLHASAGVEKYWLSDEEYARLAGVELVKNRIDMTARLGGDAVVMHLPAEPEDPARQGQFWRQLRKSLDALEPFARARGVRIAVENLITNFETINKLFAHYSPEFLGLCYDSGHANINGNRMDYLEGVKERLIVLHLHDNDGSGDQHKLLFTGTIDWDRLAGIIARSSYRKCVSLEVSIRQMGSEDEAAFLEKAFETGANFAAMIAQYKGV